MPVEIPNGNGKPKRWQRFTMALVIVIGANVLCFTGKIDPQSWALVVVVGASGFYSTKFAELWKQKPPVG